MVKPSVKGENKEEKFKRIAAKRTTRVLRDLRLLGNCSNRATYKYNVEDVGKIFSSIDKELKRVKSLFNRPQDSEFSLS